MTAQISYLLDTNVISEMMRPVPAARVVGFLDSVADQGLGLASITVWEILNGVGKLPAGRRRDELQTRFRGIVQTYFEDRVLDWSVGDAEACARLMERKRRSGEPLDDHLPDAMLAGLAVNRNLTIVTRNENEFRNTGARMVNSWAAL